MAKSSKLPYCSACGRQFLPSEIPCYGERSPNGNLDVYHIHCGSRMTGPARKTPSLVKKCTRCGQETADQELVDVAPPGSQFPEPVCFECIDKGRCPECEGRT